MRTNDKNLFLYLPLIYVYISLYKIMEGKVGIEFLFLEVFEN